jgi:hypothetical protein
MNMQIHQMQFNYSPFEDRLLFRFNTTAAEEFRLWLTRRYTKLIWPVLLDILASFETLAPNQLIRETLMSFQHETVMARADFATPYQGSEQLRRPLGAEPVLLARFSVRPSANNIPILCLHPENGKGVELAMNPTLLHSFCGLLIHAVKHSGWDLSLELGARQPLPSKVSIN